MHLIAVDSAGGWTAPTLLTFIAAVIAAGVGIYNARLGRYVRERWWERKVDTYSSLIDALSDVINDAEADLHRYHQQQDRTADDYEKKRSEIVRDKNLALRKAAAIGTFMISSRASLALSAYVDKEVNYDDNDWYTCVSEGLAAAKACMDDLVAAAHSDLGTNRGLRPTGSLSRIVRRLRG